MAGFVDESQLNVKGGDGGAGCVSFRREGPVVYGRARTGATAARAATSGWSPTATSPRCSPSATTRTARAGNGVHGKGKDLHGKRGADLEIRVPEGTVVRDLYTGEVLADLVGQGDRWLAAAGGRGGRGNAKFLSNRRRAPSFAEQGEHGEERWLKLELKLMADVALVGLPQRRQEHLHQRASRRPSPRSPTTRSRRSSPTSASSGSTTASRWWWPTSPASSRAPARAAGSGTSSSATWSGPGCCACWSTWRRSRRSQPAASRKRCCSASSAPTGPISSTALGVVVGSKADVASCSRGTGCRCRRSPERACRRCSARSAALVEEARQAEPPSDGFVIHRPQAEGVEVERVGEHEFRVHGRAALRAVALSDMRDAGALAYADHRLKSLGVDKALARAGAAPGDVVHVGEFSFDYEPDL